MLTALFILILPLVPFVIDNIRDLIQTFPVYLKEASQTLGITITIDAKQIQNYLSNEINTVSSNAYTLTTQVFGGLFSFLMIFVLTFYMLWYYEEFKKLFSRMFPSHGRAYILSTLEKINDKLGAWLRGQVILSVFVSVISWITLTALGIPNALPLALLSGILEIVPTLGPILSSIPAIIVALTISPQLALTVTIAYILIQLIENNLLVPKVMERAVGLNPIVIILGVLIGANLIGIAGALLAIPIITFVVVIFKSLDQKPS
jgi:predicted PurR-regulated permease PerM